MAEYALVIGGVFIETRHYGERPPHILHKSVQWFPVLREEGEEFGGVIGDEYVIRTPPASPSEPGTTQPSLVASAFNVSVEGGDIPLIDGIFNVAAAIYFDVGQYMLLFLTPQPDDGFFVAITGGAPCMAIAGKNAEYIIVESKDSVGGQPVDPTQFGIQVYRT